MGGEPPFPNRTESIFTTLAEIRAHSVFELGFGPDGDEITFAEPLAAWSAIHFRVTLFDIERAISVSANTANRLKSKTASAPLLLVIQPCLLLTPPTPRCVLRGVRSRVSF